MNRRTFLAASTALAFARPALAEAAPHRLRATSRVLDINGRAAKVWGLLRDTGQPGLVLDPGERFAVELRNDLPEPTIIHWHGQIPPNAQDGVAGQPAPMLQLGERRAYDFAARPGTHWMHAHIPEHELHLLAAPLIVRRPEDLRVDRQVVTLFLHDFSFGEPGEILAAITGGVAMVGMAHGDAPAMDHSKMDMGDMAMDLNDFDFDAYLANDRTLSDPEVVRVDKSGRALLRIINGAAATVFWIDTGQLVASLVAVDGEPVAPLVGSRFGIAMGQRLDLQLDLPVSGTFPILALREGARERTGIILATPGAVVNKLLDLSEAAHPGFSDLVQESALRAVDMLPTRATSNTQTLMLEGTMMPYRWTINGQTWGDHAPVGAAKGERVELTFHNMSMMAHPMHLHGHAFQVISTGGARFAGALRDTVHVPPMAAVTVALDAGEAARWMLHCHNAAHMAAGMMTEFAVSSA